MTNAFFSRRNRPFVLAALCLATLASLASPVDATPLFSGRDGTLRQAPAAANALPRSANAGSGTQGTMNPAALGAPELDLTLADGRTITARLQRVARDDNKHVQSWVGTFDDAPGSVLVLTKSKGTVTGFANYKNLTLEILPTRGGKHVLFAVDDQRLPQGDGVIESTTGGADLLAATSDYGTGGLATTAATGAVTQDILILYTSAAANAWGQTNLVSMIQSGVQSANQAYQNSYANVTLNVVGLQQSPVAESGSGMSATLSALKQNSSVRSLRDKLAADMVLLVSQEVDYCGYSSLTMTTLNGVTNTDAYSVAGSSCLSSQTLAHEIGHLQRLDHNRENSSGSGLYAYSYGYRMCVTGGFRDIMSYPCSGVPRVLQYSNPSVRYNGYATGISYEADPAHSAETARTLNNTATMVAAYRVGSSGATTIPAAPSGLAVKSVAYNYVTVGWTDNSSNETGFKLLRSTDGVNFTEIATLGAGALSFKDAAVAARTTYYYRARSYNSAGSSALSNTVSVTTPAATTLVPVAPSGITAANKANGSALITWVDASNNETGFEVYRYKWDAVLMTWNGWKKVGAVVAGATSYSDYAGKGKYRYYVRAINTAGGSAYAGPAQVRITGG